MQALAPQSQELCKYVFRYNIGLLLIANQFLYLLRAKIVPENYAVFVLSEKLQGFEMKELCKNKNSKG